MRGLWDNSTKGQEPKQKKCSENRKKEKKIKEIKPKLEFLKEK